ncbi:autotransporter outer membrane beta-barrel domain-containing protein [Synechococcus sp. CB0205]|uniref:autotransporter outer membrane beta-barrel domain-containing protein n=1 Tax=Synechococcus sp. CB0205 TaxID=232363 RepID=UPI0018DE9B61|nr:autotransporter outer membrane beta-barrel domain-containing protein [Synechococcus sp. CB0205]
MSKASVASAKRCLERGEPQITGSWTHNEDHAWSETGGGVFNLRYSDYSDNFLQTLLALKVSAPLNSGQRSLVNPFIRIGWVADWDLNNANANVTNIFSGRSASIPIVQDNESGILLEGGVDYTINNLGSTSFKLFAKGGAEIWGDSQKTADWRASGGVTFLFGGAPKGKPQPVVDVESTPAPQPEAVPVRGLW